MKSVLIALVVLGSSAQAIASEVVMSEQRVSLDVDISSKNLKLSTADYQAPTVKVLVPELADVTILNHRNTREGAPCLATYQTKLPNDVIQSKPARETVEFKISLIKVLEPDFKTGVCLVLLRERVEAAIRGFKFEHERLLQAPSRKIQDCR